MEELRSALIEIVNEDPPATVRQVFYQAVTRDLIAKTEAEYKSTVVRLLGQLRLDGEIPFDAIADNTRWMRKPSTHRGLENVLREVASFYRRDLWHSQDAYVEIWLEKEALASVIYRETEEWDVPLMVTRGYASLSYLHSAAEAIKAGGKPAFLYYLGDYDPSGLDISHQVERRLREFAPKAEIHFQRVAVTKQQIRRLRLPTRPTKTSDSRAKGFKGESVEVDAIPPGELRRIVRDCIARHVDAGEVERLRRVEELERETLWSMAHGLEEEDE